MAMNTEAFDKNRLGIKVEGDFEDLQIIEESSDSEEESGSDKQIQGNVGTRSPLPHSNHSTDLVHSTNSRVFGSVAVTHSEHVHFGDKHIKIFNGPVSIKQIVNPNTGVVNSSYVKTEDENAPHNVQRNNKHSALQKFKVQLWHKLTFSAIGVVLIGGICAIVFITQNKSLPNNMSKHSDEDFSMGDPSNETNRLVVGHCYENYQVIIISITLIPLIFLLLYSFLTSKLWVVPMKNNICRHSNSNGFSINFTADELLIAPNHLRIVSRTDWLAQPVELPLDVIRQPVPWVIITHTATESCHNQSACVLAVRLIQTFHIESKGWYDIGYNFLVGGDGSAYYGRGWDFIGAHTKGYNKYSIGIAFIGTFNKENPPKQQVEACKKLIKMGVDEGKLSKDYKLFAHRQLMSTLSPGDTVFDIIKEWPHFVKNYTSDLIPNY